MGFWNLVKGAICLYSTINGVPRCPECLTELPRAGATCPHCHPFQASAEKFGNSVLGFGANVAKGVAKEAMRPYVEDIIRKL